MEIGWQIDAATLVWSVGRQKPEMKKDDSGDNDSDDEYYAESYCESDVVGIFSDDIEWWVLNISNIKHDQGNMVTYLLPLHGCLPSYLDSIYCMITNNIKVVILT